jgi:hypothetical protein
MSRRSAATRGDTGALELITDCAPMNAQLGTDLTEGPTLGVQVGYTLNVHGVTVTAGRPPRDLIYRMHRCLITSSGCPGSASALE